VAVFCEPCTDLARLIEAGATRETLGPRIAHHVQALATRIGRDPDRAILGCTHYEIVADLFEQALRPGTPVIHQPAAVADAMARYLDRHPEYAPGERGLRRFLTTGEARDQNGLAANFWGSALRFETAA
jgi:glutamate racemase